MKILLVGDIVGAPGRNCFKRVAKQLLESGEVHAIIANAENAAAGSGITSPVAQELFDAGATLLTLGDHTWGQRGFDAQIGSEKRIVRPANFPESNPGATVAIAETAFGPIAVVSLLGQVFMMSTDNPFRAIDKTLSKIPATIPVFVDMHAEATSEKIAMGYWLDGRVACVFGTHTHVEVLTLKSGAKNELSALLTFPKVIRGRQWQSQKRRSALSRSSHFWDKSL